MDPATIAALLGGVGSIFGGGDPEYVMSPAEAWKLRMAKMLFREAKGRVPGAAPDERMALANAQALTGEQAMQMQGGLFADSAGGYGDTSASSGDMLQRLNSMLLSQKAQINAQMMQGFIQNKRADMMGALGQAPVAGGMWQNQGSDLSGIFGDLAQAYAMQQGMQKKKPGVPEGSPTQAGTSSETQTPVVPGLPQPTAPGTTVASSLMSPQSIMPTTPGSGYGSAYKWWG